MERRFTTTAEQDAALAWRVAQINDPQVTEDVLIAQFAQQALTGLVGAYRDAEGARVYAAYAAAGPDAQAAVKAALRLE